jgi:adenosylmethionine-8-amino-7-oxononanoate aminotransferase
LLKVAPKNLSRVFFSDCGASAIEVALKMAYQYYQQTGKSADSKRTKFVALGSAYHGDTIGAVSLGGIDFFHKKYKPLLFDALRIPSPYCYRCELNLSYPSCNLACAQKLDSLLNKNKGKVCAVVVESVVQAAAGMIVAPPGHLKMIEKICRNHDVFLICDEVATGFGRTGAMFACNTENVQPDIMTVGKGLTGGYLPVSATLTTEKIFKGFYGDYSEQKTFFHGHSFAGNALGCAAAVANLKLFKSEKTLERLKLKIQQLTQGLERFKGLLHAGDVRQKGFIAGIELVHNKKTKEPYRWREKIGVQVIKEARRHGVLLRPLGSVIVLYPPLSISKKELNLLLDVTYNAIRKVTGK